MIVAVALQIVLGTVVGGGSMQADLQQTLDRLTAATGYGISFGYVSTDGTEIALGSGNRQPANVPKAPNVPSGTVNKFDTFQMGSGTKPFTATAVMQLVEEGKVRLGDLVQEHVDGPMQRMWNTSFVALFGPPAATVTVDQLLRMNSGLSDFEGGNGNPNFDYPTLVNGTAHPTVVHSPLESFEFVGQRGFVCKPGTCFSYSTCGFMVAGLILLAHAPPGNDTWETFDQIAMLGLDKAQFPQLTMEPFGPMWNASRLTTVGDTTLTFPHSNTRIPIWTQDQSIMSWTGGYAVSNGLGIARFLFNLLVPGHMKYLKQSSIDIMNNVSDMNKNSQNGGHNYQYGLGLMHSQIPGDFDPNRYPANQYPVGQFVGHDGMTYGFSSTNGYFPAINATLSVIINQDAEFFFSRNTVACPLVEIIAFHKGLGKVDLNCQPPVSKWTKGQGDNCYGTRDGGKTQHGAKDLETPPSSSCGVMSLDDCKRKCMETKGCDGVTVRTAKAAEWNASSQDQQYACFRKGNVDLGKCDHGTDFDTYVQQ